MISYSDYMAYLRESEEFDKPSTSSTTNTGSKDFDAPDKDIEMTGGKSCCGGKSGCNESTEEDIYTIEFNELCDFAKENGYESLIEALNDILEANEELTCENTVLLLDEASAKYESELEEYGVLCSVTEAGKETVDVETNNDDEYGEIKDVVPDDEKTSYGFDTAAVAAKNFANASDGQNTKIDLAMFDALNINESLDELVDDFDEAIDGDKDISDYKTPGQVDPDTIVPHKAEADQFSPVDDDESGFDAEDDDIDDTIDKDGSFGSLEKNPSIEESFTEWDDLF